jgi:hypothetical protein
MADTKLTGLTEDTTPSTSGLLYYVDDPSGSPVSRKVTVLNALALGTGKLTAYTNAANFYRHTSPTATSRFDALINGTPTSAANSVVTFDTVTNGNVTSITPAATGQLAQMRLYNTTRGDYALIVSATGATVTLDRNVRTLANPWADNDAITNYKTNIGNADGFFYAELEVTDATLLGKSALMLDVSCRSGTAGDTISLHPFSTAAATKGQNATALVTTLVTTRTVFLPLTSNVIGLGWTGTGITALIIKVTGYVT